MGRSVFHIARLPQRRPNAVILLFPVRAQKLSFLVSNLVPKRIKRAGLLSMQCIPSALLSKSLKRAFETDFEIRR